MTVPDPSRRLARLLERLREQPGPDAAPAEGPSSDVQRMRELVRSFLVWEAGERRAAAALDAVASSLVDFNELRVCLPRELCALLGRDYPRPEERCQRLRAVLNDIFKRENAVTLEAPARLGKREARAYLTALDGMPAFVADRLTLVLFGGHAFPVDARLAVLLAREGVAERPDAESVASWMERQIHAGEALEAYRLIERWADEADSTAEHSKATRRARTRKRADDS